jgi:hypothetical protein
MATHEVLDIDIVARIGLMYLDGDKLETVLINKTSASTDDITYEHAQFNELKISLLRLERINPDLKLNAVLWQQRPGNPNVVMPVVVGSALPCEGPDFPFASAAMKAVFCTGESRSVTKPCGCMARYFAVRNSDELIAGVLELYGSKSEKNDI